MNNVPNRIQQDVEVLVGRRNINSGERAVRLKELQDLDQRATALAGSLQRQIVDAGIPSIRDKVERIRAFIYNTRTYVDNEVQGARDDLQTLIDAQGVTIADIQSNVATNAAGITQEAAARAAEDTALAGQITTISTQVGANSSDITAEQLARTNADTALAADITTLQSDFGAASATLTQQGQALSTLEGYAAATYVLRAAAGGASAGLEIVAADDPVSGAASALRFYADDILFDGSVTAHHIAAFGITADKIDTRGLDIRDAAGNVIFSSGSGISATYVSGLGALATADTLGYSSLTGSKPPPDADRTASNTAAAIANQGSFATLNQINVHNVSTYIASAAIRNAQIENASITTLKIFGGAVSKNAVATGVYSASASVTLTEPGWVTAIASFTQGTGKNAHRWRLNIDGTEVQTETPQEATTGALTGGKFCQAGSRNVIVACDTTTGDGRCGVTVFGLMR